MTEFLQTPEKLGKELEEIDKSIIEISNRLAEKESKSSSRAFDSGALEHMRRKKTFTQGQLESILKSDSSVGEQAFPVVFGFDAFANAVPEPWGDPENIWVGHEIDLKHAATHVYVPSEKLSAMQEWCAKMELPVKAYSLEAVDMIRRADPTLWKVREEVGSGDSYATE